MVAEAADRSLNPCAVRGRADPRLNPGWGRRSGLKAGSLCLSRGVELKAGSLSCGRTRCPPEQRLLLDELS
ncbi:hypothetical protein VZT92_008147 [Zoarces viviparus]|uniref:Uncharacterized protein n=1 Tax=Zoarces viviparus TaxID=48416 RepID=A0AAW1FM67_ZOAVI